MADMQYDIRIEARQAIGQLKKVQTELRGLRKDMRKTDASTKSSTSSMGKMKVAAGALAVAFTAFKALKISAEFERLQNEINLLSENIKEAESNALPRTKAEKMVSSINKEFSKLHCIKVITIVRYSSIFRRCRLFGRKVSVA